MKEWDCHDFEALDPGKELQRHGMNGDFCKRENENQNGEAESDRDRHAGQHERYQQYEDKAGARARQPSADVTELRGQAQCDEQNGNSDEEEGCDARALNRQKERLVSPLWQMRSPWCPLTSSQCSARKNGILRLDALDLRNVMVRQLSGPREGVRDLQEPKAHQIAAARNGEVDDPCRQLEVGDTWSVCAIIQTKRAPKLPITPVNRAPHNNPNRTMR